MNIIDSIGSRLAAERKRLKLSQTDFVKLVHDAGAKGATRQSQSKYEKGERMPDAGYFSAIASAGVDINFVLTGRDAEAELKRIAARDAKIENDLAFYSSALKKAQHAIKESAPMADAGLSLAPEEVDIINKYRSSTQEGRRAIIAVVNAVNQKQ